MEKAALRAASDRQLALLLATVTAYNARMDVNPYKSPAESAQQELPSAGSSSEAIGWRRPTALAVSVFGWLFCAAGPYWIDFDYFREPLALCFLVCAVGSLLFLVIKIGRVARDFRLIE